MPFIASQKALLILQSHALTRLLHASGCMSCQSADHGDECIYPPALTGVMLTMLSTAWTIGMPFYAGFDQVLLMVMSVVPAGTVAVYNPNNSSIDRTDFYNTFANYWYAGSYTALRLVTGTYSVVNPIAGFHLIAGCSGISHAPFELDLGGSTLILQVRYYTVLLRPVPSTQYMLRADFGGSTLILTIRTVHPNPSLSTAAVFSGSRPVHLHCFYLSRKGHQASSH